MSAIRHPFGKFFVFFRKNFCKNKTYVRINFEYPHSYLYYIFRILGSNLATFSHIFYSDDNNLLKLNNKNSKRNADGIEFMED